jgi:uncharacterized protein (TIGR03435 family)
MAYFAFRLQERLDRPVVDQTNLKGGYDFTLAYTMDRPPGLAEGALINGKPRSILRGPHFQRRCASRGCG